MANALSMLAILFSLTLVASERPTWSAASWIAGVAAFTVVAFALRTDAFRRVEIALIAGFATATICMALTTVQTLRQLPGPRVTA